MRILIVEDDERLAQGLSSAFFQEAMESTWVRTIHEAEVEMQQGGVALILLDRWLQDGDGINLLKRLRRKDNLTPVIVLTAQETIDIRVESLDEGADDFLAKPFAVPELLSRIRALIRRSAGFAGRVWKLGEVSMCHESREVMLRGVPVELSPREYQVLHLLIRNTGQVMTRARIEDELYADRGGFESNTLEVHIHHLRRKLGAKLIRTVRGVGYVVKRD